MRCGMLVLQIECDVCGLLGDSGRVPAHRLRANLSRIGWKSSGARDVCPRCRDDPDGGAVSADVKGYLKSVPKRGR